jgi:hypothetical protein
MACFGKKHIGCIRETFADCTNCVFEDIQHCTINGTGCTITNARWCTIGGDGHKIVAGQENQYVAYSVPTKPSDERAQIDITLGEDPQDFLRRGVQLHLREAKRKTKLEMRLLDPKKLRITIESIAEVDEKGAEIMGSKKLYD